MTQLRSLGALGEKRSENRSVAGLLDIAEIEDGITVKISIHDGNRLSVHGIDERKIIGSALVGRKLYGIHELRHRLFASEQSTPCAVEPAACGDRHRKIRALPLHNARLLQHKTIRNAIGACNEANLRIAEVGNSFYASGIDRRLFVDGSLHSSAATFPALDAFCLRVPENQFAVHLEIDFRRGNDDNPALQDFISERLFVETDLVRPVLGRCDRLLAHLKFGIPGEFRLVRRFNALRLAKGIGKRREMLPWLIGARAAPHLLGESLDSGLDAIPVVRFGVGGAVLLLAAKVVPESKLAACELRHILLGNDIAPVDLWLPSLIHLLAVEIVVVVAAKGNEIDDLVGNGDNRIASLERSLGMVIAVVPDVDRDVAPRKNGRLAVCVAKRPPCARLVAKAFDHLEHGIDKTAKLLGLRLVVFISSHMNIRADERGGGACHVFGEKRLEPCENFGRFVEIEMIRAILL